MYVSVNNLYYHFGPSPLYVPRSENSLGQISFPQLRVTAYGLLVIISVYFIDKI